MIDKQPIIIYDCCEMRNHISDKCMTRVTVFNPSVICQRVAKYNAKHGLTPKYEPIDWKPNPTIDQHHFHHKSPSIRPYSKRTEPISTYKQQHLSDLLSSFYANGYTQYNPPLGIPPCSHYVSHDNYDDIKTALSPESYKPQISEFLNVDINQIPVYKPSLEKNTNPLFPDYDQELSRNNIRVLRVH